MSKENHPTRLQGYLSAFNRRVVQPAKNALNSDIVRENITEPAKKWANEGFVKQYITDPIANASTGRRAADLRRMAKGAKEGVMNASKPLFPPGLTEADVKPTTSRKKTASVETGPQGTRTNWEEDDWENDEDSVLRSGKPVEEFTDVVEFMDERGQLQMSVERSGDIERLDDITDTLRTPEEKKADHRFRDTEKLNISDEDKVLMMKEEHDKSVKFGTEDMEFDRKVNPLDIENFAKAKGVQRPQAVVEESEIEVGRAQQSAPRGAWSNRERVFSREGAVDYREKRQTSRGRYEEAENARYIKELMAKPIVLPPQNQSGPAMAEPTASPPRAQSTSHQSARSLDEKDNSSTESLDGVSDLGSSIGEEQIKKKLEEATKQGPSKAKCSGSPFNMFGSAQDFLAHSTRTSISRDTFKAPGRKLSVRGKTCEGEDKGKGKEKKQRCKEHEEEDADSEWMYCADCEAAEERHQKLQE